MSTPRFGDSDYDTQLHKQELLKERKLKREKRLRQQGFDPITYTEYDRELRASGTAERPIDVELLEFLKTNHLKPKFEKLEKSIALKTNAAHGKKSFKSMVSKPTASDTNMLPNYSTLNRLKHDFVDKQGLLYFKHNDYTRQTHETAALTEELLSMCQPEMGDQLFLVRMPPRKKYDTQRYFPQEDDEIELFATAPPNSSVTMNVIFATTRSDTQRLTRAVVLRPADPAVG
jgi:hypothetical protein